jgi:rRNA maturation protein Nop10
MCSCEKMQTIDTFVMENEEGQYTVIIKKCPKCGRIVEEVK